MKLTCKYCKGKGGKYLNINGRLMHFPCEHCAHRGYNLLWEHCIKHGFKDMIKSLVKRG